MENEFIQMIVENLEFIIGIPLASLVGALLVKYGANKIVKSLINLLAPWVEVIVKTIVGKYFGVTYSEGDEETKIEELPMVSQISRMAHTSASLGEMELLRLRKESVSPLYTKDQRLRLKLAYDKQFKILEPTLSVETLSALAVYDEMEELDA